MEAPFPLPFLHYYLVLGVLVQELGLHVQHALEVEGADAEDLVELDLGLLRAEDGREAVDGLLWWYVWGCGRVCARLGAMGGLGVLKNRGVGLSDRQTGESTDDSAYIRTRMRFSTVSSSCSLTRSILLRRTRSAKASCSTASFSTPSGLSSSMCCTRCLASTTVRIASRRSLACVVGRVCVVTARGCV